MEVCRFPSVVLYVYKLGLPGLWVPVCFCPQCADTLALFCNYIDNNHVILAVQLFRMVGFPMDQWQVHKPVCNYTVRSTHVEDISVLHHTSWTSVSLHEKGSYSTPLVHPQRCASAVASASSSVLCTSPKSMATVCRCIMHFSWASLLSSVEQQCCWYTETFQEAGSTAHEEDMCGTSVANKWWYHVCYMGIGTTTTTTTTSV